MPGEEKRCIVDSSAAEGRTLETNTLESNTLEQGAHDLAQERQILTLIFPRLLCELAREVPLSLTEHAPIRKPLAVVLKQDAEQNLKPTHPLTAVCPLAHRLGVRPGQTSAEASALVAGLVIKELHVREVQEKLGAIAEVASQFGTSLCWQVPDTIWVDVSGVSHLFGGEEALAQEAQERVRSLGHLVRAVVAPGPRVGQALGRFREQSTLVVSATQAEREMSELPLTALPLSGERVGWFARLGIYSLGQLTTLPPKTLSARLGSHALLILELIRGIDRSPLIPRKLSPVLCEEIEWEEAVDGLSPLLFALRGLVARLSARLSGRGEASSRLECEIEHDRAHARERGLSSHTSFVFEIASPLHREGDLERVVKSRLERTQLEAPSVGMRLRASELSPQVMKQVGLSSSGGNGFQTGTQPIQEFSVLLAELHADVGPENWGVLEVWDSHLPEQRSRLVALSVPSLPPRTKRPVKKTKASVLSPCPAMDRVTRLLSVPHRLHALPQVGGHFGLGAELYTIKRLRFLERLDGVHWWTEQAARRDYFWAELQGLHGYSEALVFVEKNTGELYLQGWVD